MALTRKMLKAMGIEDDKIDQIIEAHGETVEGLKAERDGLKEKADKADALQKRVEELESDAENDEYKGRYESEHQAFEDYKKQVAGEAAEREKRSLYRELLKESGIDPRRIDLLMKVADLSGVTVKDGKIDKAKELAESVKKEWAEFVVTPGTKGAPVDKPPAGEPKPPKPKSLADALHERYDHKEQ